MCVTFVGQILRCAVGNAVSCLETLKLTQNSVAALRETHSVSILVTNLLLLFREVTPPYRKNGKKDNDVARA